MLFHSQPFLLGFLPVFLLGFFLLGRFAGHGWALGWMLAGSLVFYGWWNPEFVLLPEGSIVGTYAIATRIRRQSDARAARRWLVLGVALNLFLLGWFKYADFLLHSVAPHAPALGIFLPLAISFFTFQQRMRTASLANDLSRLSHLFRSAFRRAFHALHGGVG